MKNYYYINKKNLKIETTTDSNKIDKFNNDLSFLKKISKNTENVHKHPYHLVDPSPWPFVISFGLFFFTFGTAMFFHGYTGGGSCAYNTSCNGTHIKIFKQFTFNLFC